MNPRIVSVIPLIKKIVTIKLGHPITEYPNLIALKNIITAPINERREKIIPINTANFRGRSENERIMSEANLILFLKVYEGLPECLTP